MRFVAVVLVADIAVLQHKQEFSFGYMQVRSRRVRTDDLFHALTTYQKSAPRLVVMPIIEQRADGFRTDVFSALVQVRIRSGGGERAVAHQWRSVLFDYWQKAVFYRAKIARYPSRPTVTMSRYAT